MKIQSIGRTGQLTKAMATAMCEQVLEQDSKIVAKEVNELLAPLYDEEPTVKTASTEAVQIDPKKSEDALLNQLLLSKLAQKFEIKVDLVKRGKKKNKRTKHVTKADESKLDTRLEATDMVSFPAVANNNDPDYACSVKLHNPQNDIIAVSVYLVETNIGQYAYKNNFFFKPGNDDLAKRCFRRVSLAVRDVREDVAAGYNLQHEVPSMIAKRLQGEESEVQQEVKQFAVYLDPKNIGRTDAGKHNFPSIRETSSRLKT